MRSRIQEMRSLLAAHLREITGDGTFDFIKTQRGMFSLLGVPSAEVGRLRTEHHIYMTADSRMNIAGIMPHNVAYVAASVAAVRSAGARVAGSA
jgi:aspartate/tyrosine/aromatic aminotransferase